MINSVNQDLILIEGAATYERILEAVRDGEAEEGIQYIRDFLKIFPEFARAHNDIAVLYHRSGDSLKALAHYEKALKLDQGNVTYRKNLADFYFVEIEWTGEAVHIYLDIVKDNPFDTEALNALGSINLQLGRKEKARQFFTRALQADPSNQDAQLGLQQLPSAGGAPKMISPAFAGTQTTPEIPIFAPVTPPLSTMAPEPRRTDEDLHREAYQMADAGNISEGIRLLEKLLAQNPSHALAHNDLGVLYQKAGNPQKSRSHHEDAVRLKPDSIVFQKNLADLLFAEFGELEEALGIYVKLFAKNQFDVEIMKAIAHVCIQVEKKDDAKFFLRKALEIKPWDQDLRELLNDLDSPQLTAGGR